jgi:hypothetical protein
MLAVTVLVAGRMRRPARAACAPGGGFVPGDDLIPGREQLPGRSGRRNG